MQYVSKIYTQNIGDIATDSDAIKVPFMKVLRKIKVTAVKFGVDTAVTATDTNYQKVALTDKTNDIASIVTGPATGGDSLSAGEFLSATTGPVAGYVEQPAGADLQIEFTKAGSGMALSGLTVQMEYQEYDS